MRDRFLRADEEEILRLVFQTKIRDKSNSKTDAGHVNEQIVAAELYLRQQFQLMLQENVVQKFTCRALAV